MSAMILEIAVVVLALAILLLDLWTVPARKHLLGYGAAAALLLVLAYSFVLPDTRALLFNGSFVLDPMALFFKRLFLLAAIIVLLMSVHFSDRLEAGISEFYSLILFALAGMLFASSANDFTMLFVSVELVTVTFYVLISFQRRLLASLEAGLKYLILGALSTGFTVYGIALVFGLTGSLRFDVLATLAPEVTTKPLFQAGLLFVFLGLGFKIAAFPMHIWAPDVYQGSPAPITAFLAIGSKAAGFVLLLRFLFIAVPQVTVQWTHLFIFISAITILYGNLCAIPQRNLKRLLGYSSISHAGYLLLGIAAMAANPAHSEAGASAILYYLAGYLFAVLAAFAVLIVAASHVDDVDIATLSGLNQRSPFLAVALTLSLVSLAGIPPLAGFFGKFLLLKSALEQGSHLPAFYILTAIAIGGVVISIWYYFGVIRVIYWGAPGDGALAPKVPLSLRLAILVCIAGMLFLGIAPQRAMDASERAAAVFNGGNRPVPSSVTAAR